MTSLSYPEHIEGVSMNQTIVPAASWKVEKGERQKEPAHKVDDTGGGNKGYG